jgi:hypothetical protein
MLMKLEPTASCVIEAEPSSDPTSRRNSDLDRLLEDLPETIHRLETTIMGRLEGKIAIITGAAGYSSPIP